jgi:serine/threonine protein kinase
MENDKFMEFNKYKFNREDLIGRGLTSEVYRGINKLTLECVAIKIIKKHTKYSYLVKNEIANLKILAGHPNIIWLLESHETNNEYILIFEYIELTLKKYLETNQKVNLETNQTVNLIKQLLTISDLLYKNKIVHHDIKSENILIKIVNKETLQLKLCDFGFSLSPKQILHKKLCGSPIYMHPTKLLYNNNFNSDEWSLNIIFYEIVYGVHPFKGIQTKTELVNTIQKNHIKFPEENIFTPILRKLLLSSGNVFISAIKKDIEEIDLIDDDYVIL